MMNACKVGWVRKDCYNLCGRVKRKLVQKGDAVTVIEMMNARKQKDPEFYFDYQLDENERLKTLFWCDSQSRRDYAEYGDVLVFDSTYKMNRYGMPFVPFVGLNNHRRTIVFACALVSDEKKITYVWLLRTFLKAMYQKKPKSVITDADGAMIRAIRKVLEGVIHRICSWHIEKNMKKHLCYKSLAEFRALVYYSTSRAIFEERWAAFVRRWKSERNKTWLDRMYQKRHLWAAAYLSHGFFLGMKSNQRSESLNSCLHLHLKWGMKLFELVLHYENCVTRLREEEARENCVTYNSVPVPITKYRDFEILLGAVFSPANFYMLQKDLGFIDGLVVKEVKDGKLNREYVVAWTHNPNLKFLVQYDTGNLDATLQCSCRRMSRKGLPCKHILFVLTTRLKVKKIPSCCVLPRLSKKPSNGMPVKRTSDLDGWAWSGVGSRDMYSKLTTATAEASHVACNDPILAEEVMAFCRYVMSKKVYTHKGVDGHKSVSSEDARTDTRNIIQVGDPIKVKSKGARKKYKRAASAEDDHPMSKNGRPLGFDEIKKIKCGACHGSGHNRRNKKCKLHPK